MNLPEGFVLEDEEPTGFSNLPEGFVLEEEEPKDVGTLQQMKQSGQQLSREQERILFDAEEEKPLTQKASEAISTFFPIAINTAKQLGTGAGEFIYKGILKPIDAMSQSPEEAEKTLKEAGNIIRSGVHGVAQDIQETADAAVRFAMFGSNITDKLLGKSKEERFEKYMLREGMRQFSQKIYEDNPDAAARLLAENPLLQNLAYAAALAQGGTEEEAQAAKKAYEQLVKESGLSKDEINENVALLGEVVSPLSLPGTNRITETFGKATGKVTQKAGELALKGIVAPLAKGVAKTAGGVETGIEAIQTASRKIGEYTVGDPDTFVRSAANTFIALPAKLPAKMTRGIATTIADVASQAGPGRRGMFELGGRAADAGDLTKRLFSPESMGGKGRAKAADWAVRQANAIIQPAVNGAVLNVALGLPDIETARDLGYTAGVGAGIGAYGGARLMERGAALIDPTTGLAEKIDAIVTPDPAQLRKDQDADIQRFVQTADPTLMSSIDELSNINNIKSALDLKIKNLEAKKAAQIRKEDEKRIQDQIDLFTQQRKGLDKATPQTEAEIKRQVQLSFADAMDLAKTTGAAAGLNNIQVKVLRPDQMDDFYRDLYGKTLTDAESVVRQLVGNPRLSPSEQELLNRADQTIKQYLQDVAGASTARGFAISERTGQPDHLKLQNQKGATVVINGDLVAQMGRDGLNIGRVINHEMQHALSNFQEVRDMLAPIRKELFDQKILNPDGTFEVVSKGIVSDADLDKFALRYAAAMDSAGGASFLSQFANQDQLRNYMKEEYLSELAGLSGGIQGNLRENLDSVGRSVVDWIETKTKNGALKRIKEGLRNYGVVVDDQGQFSSVIGANLNPEAMAMMRQYQRGLRDLNESLVYNSNPLKDAPEIPLTELATNRVLQERYKHSDFFEQEQVVKMTTPDGQTQEIVVPPGAKVDSFVSDYRFANGQLVDEQGNPVTLGPDIPLQAMPDGTSISVDTRIARNADGSPRILSPRESKRRAKKRGEAIRKVIDEAPDDGSGVRLEDTGNGNYRGTLSPTQIAAINALPNDLVAPSLKRKIAFFNDILGRKDGSIVEIEYQAALRDGKYRALQPQMRTEIPIGFQFDKQGNFLMTTMSLSRMHDKANAWAAKRPRNLSLWGGDMTKFWDSVRQYLHNHKAGLQGHIGLHPDPAVAMDMKNRINDLFNVYRKETREANPVRTTLPKRRGQDSRDVVIRSRRMDRVNSYDETALPKMPFSYELAVQNYLPAENPFAELQTPEQFAQGMEVDAELARLAAQGNVEPLELQLHEQDLLRPAEYVDVQDGKLRVRSMFDPTQAVFDPMESEPEKPSLEVVETEVEMPQATQFMPATIEAPSGERGFKSKLQTEIQNKFKGANATPEQLKAVVGNPQFVKPEEVKWSGVMDEIDRLAQENKGKVPVQELINYLRNEGQVKFEEVTLGGNQFPDIDTIRYNIENNEDGYGLTQEEDTIAITKNGQIITDFHLDDSSFWENVEEDLKGKTDRTRFSEYQLPGGKNYREVVLSMPPSLSRQAKQITDKYGIPYEKSSAYLLKEKGASPEEISQYTQGVDQASFDPTFTSSHFPNVPNYIAHMRVNERTIQGTGYAVRNTQSGRKGPIKATREEAEADLKQYPASYSLEIVEVPRDEEGLFVEEFQSDRHQQGREKGYVGEQEIPEGYKLIDENQSAREAGYEVPLDAPPRWRYEGPGIFSRIYDSKNEAIEAAWKDVSYAGKTRVPDAPFRKDWGVQLFKRALRDAVESGKKWIGWTTGETQAERYDLSKQVDRIDYSIDEDGLYSASAIKNKNEVFSKEGMELSEVEATFGKELAQKMQENKGKKRETEDGDEYRSLVGLDLKVGGEGMKGFYDTILPKEIGKYVAKMGGKVEKDSLAVESGFKKFSRAEGQTDEKLPESNIPIWRVNITPEMENVVRAGQIQFMPVENIRDQVIDAYFDEFLKDSPFDDSVRVEKQGPQYTREEFREAYNNGEIDQFDFDPGIRRQVTSQFPGYFGQETQFSNATVTSPGVQFLPVYHGTKTRIPAEEGFQLKYVGTGQGKQAWGWGLYFATNPKVVERSYPSQFRYKVDLDLNPEDALDYDAPIDPRLLESAQQLSAEVGAELITNGDYYEALSDKLGTPKDASMELLSMGIPAIRYLDGRSRSPKVPLEDKTYNYVVFDESKIRILDESDTLAGPVTQFMPAEAPSGERGFQSKLQLEIQKKFQGAMPSEQQQGMAGVEAPQTYRRISDMIPPLQGVELPEAIAKGTGEFGILRQALQGMESPGAVVIPDIPEVEVESVVEKPKEVPPDQSAFISEKALRKFDSLGDKNATQVDADNMKYPVNTNPDSVALPGRWGLVNAKITGMPKTFKEVSEIIDRQVNRLVRLVNANPEFAKESARFYRDMAESATMITDAAFPQVKGLEKYLFDELVLRFLALGSPRTSVASNATKSAGSIAVLIDEFEAGYKIGFGEQSHGAKTTYNAWKDGGHFDLSLPGVQDKVRTFYLNSLSELIEMAEAQNDSASVEELMLRAGKSMRVLDPDRTSKLSDVEKKEIQRLLDGKATVDMWDMAAKGWAWPGFLIFKNRRNSVKKPFQWSQDDFERVGTFADKSWKQVQDELKIKSPADLRYQQARALKIDGNPDWTLETWNERKSQPFPDSTKFSYYTQGTEAGLSPGGGGPLYDAQQAIDGLLADRLNELGLAPLFGKTKLKARNAQEILWALEKMDNPDETNNDLSLFGNTFEPFLNEVLKLRLGKDVDKESRAENVLAAMERAYMTMAEQLIPIEVVSSGTSEEAKRIQDAIKNLKSAGDPNPEKTITLHIADGLGKAVNDLAIKHGIKATIENVDIGDGGYTEEGKVAVAPNIRITLRGNPQHTFLLLETLSRAMDQDGGNVIRKPTMRELNDSRVEKNLILTIPTTGLNQAQRNKMFLDLSMLKDASGESFLTGFTEVEGGIAIGNQFYDGDFEAAIALNKSQIDSILQNYKNKFSDSKFETAIIQKFKRGQAATKIEPEKITVKNKEVLRPSFASDLYDYIKNRMTNLPLAGSTPAFAQKTDFANNWIDKADALFARLESYPVKTKPQKEKAKLEAPDISSNTKRTTALVDLKSELESGVLRDLISEDVANKLKARYGFKKEKQPEGEE